MARSRRAPPRHARSSLDHREPARPARLLLLSATSLLYRAHAIYAWVRGLDDVRALAALRRQKEKGKRKKGGGITQMKDIRERTFEFAVRIVRSCHGLDKKPGVGRNVSRQLLKSGTSVGANTEEAQAAQSKPDFISKNSIALKEARETHYC